MRNKSPLALMEQVLMVLVFAMAAALCLQGFALANRISTRMETRNQAITLAQNAAEIVKYYSGDFTMVTQHLNGECDGNILRIIDMPPSQAVVSETSDMQTPPLILEIAPSDSSVPLLGTATIRVLQEEEIIFEITVAWQKEDQYAEN